MEATSIKNKKFTSQTVKQWMEVSLSIESGIPVERLRDAISNNDWTQEEIEKINDVIPF